MGLIITGVIKLFILPTQQMHPIGLLLTAVMLIIFAGKQISHLASWQAQWVKSKSVMQNLQNVGIQPGMYLSIVNDQYYFSDEVSQTIAKQWVINWKELSHEVTGENSSTCKMQATIRASQYAQVLGKYGLMRTYWTNKLLQPERLEVWLKSLTELEIKRMPNNKIECISV
jgi:hypothetical protein